MPALEVRIQYADKKHPVAYGYNAWRVKWQRSDDGTTWEDVQVSDCALRTPSVPFTATVPGQYRAGATLTNGLRVDEYVFSDPFHVSEPQSTTLNLGEEA